MGRPTNGGPSDDGGQGYRVNERNRAFYSTGTGAPIDSNAMTDTPPPTARWGQEAPEITIRPPVSESVVPDIRKSARSQTEIERARPREFPRWIAPLLAAVVFVAVVGGGVFFMGSWLAYRVVTAPEEPPPVETPTDLEGVPVRKGFRETP